MRTAGPSSMICSGAACEQVFYASDLLRLNGQDLRLSTGENGEFGNRSSWVRTPINQTSFFAAGIRGVTTGNNDAIAVVIDSNGQLGTVSSSRRFKEDIHDMDTVGSGLMRLRPVTFRYQKPFADAPSRFKMACSAH